MDEPIFLVIGGSRGIGAAIAKAAAREGRRVVITYVGQADRAAQVVAEIRDGGGQAWAICADTGHPASISQLFEEADRYGPLGTLVFNSGITGGSGPLIDADPAAIARVLEVNLLGAVLAAREAARRLSIRRGGKGGSIIFMSSRASQWGAPNTHVWYAASKGGIDSLTIGLARELGSEGIRVNAVSPGPIDTEMLTPAQVEAAANVTALGRLGTPEEVAAAVLFLASDAASFVTAANIAVSGGR